MAEITNIQFQWANHPSGYNFNSSDPIFTGLTPLEAFFEYNSSLEQRGLYRLMLSLTSFAQPIPPVVQLVFSIETDGINTTTFSTKILPYNLISDIGVRISRVAMDALKELYSIAAGESSTPSNTSSTFVNVLNLANMTLDTLQPDYESLISAVEEQINNGNIFDRKKVLFELRRLRIKANSVLNVFNEPIVQSDHEFAVQILGNKKTLKNIAISEKNTTVNDDISLSFVKKLPITTATEQWIYKTIRGLYIKNVGKKDAVVPIVIAHLQSE